MAPNKETAFKNAYFPYVLHSVGQADLVSSIKQNHKRKKFERPTS